MVRKDNMEMCKVIKWDIKDWPGKREIGEG